MAYSSLEHNWLPLATQGRWPSGSQFSGTGSCKNWHPSVAMTLQGPFSSWAVPMGAFITLVSMCVCVGGGSVGGIGMGKSGRDRDGGSVGGIGMGGVWEG